MLCDVAAQTNTAPQASTIPNTTTLVNEPFVSV
jgi:hypothetical protein